jgi:hypothetical protein
MRLLVLLVLSLCLLTSSPADWRTNAGYDLLSAELGGNLPTGAGIPVLQTEASESQGAAQYLPQATAGTVAYAGTGAFLGKTFTPHSGASAASGHAGAVASYYFGAGSVSPGVTDVHVWLADDFVSEVYGTNSTMTGSVQNHSWVGSTGDDAVDQAILRKFDLMINRDHVVATTPLNNGGLQAKLMANSYHSISVGLISGGHPQTHSNLDGLGRMKPDLVVEQPVTSYAGPAVASAAALLLDVIRPSFTLADDPRVVKALLLTAASKARLPGWRRVTSARPYDEIYGAGELNVYHAYHLLQAGRQAASNTVERSRTGWDIGTSSSTQTRRYYFTIPAESWAQTFSCSLTWHRQFTGGVSNASLANLNLTLRAASALTPGAVIDQSISSVDNVEHLFLRHLSPGQYVVEVTADTGAITYGLSWQSSLGSSPQLNLQRSGSQSLLSLSQLDPLITYTVQSSTDLLSWVTFSTLRTADTAPSFSYSMQETHSGPQRFYRLQWPTWR